MKCKFCGANECEYRPEPGTHAFTVDFKCGSSVDLLISSENVMLKTIMNKRYDI